MAEPLRDVHGPIRLPEHNPEDTELNDRRELQYLQRALKALHYQKHERPKVLAEISKLKDLLQQETADDQRRAQLEAIAQDPGSSEDNREAAQNDLVTEFSSELLEKEFPSRE